MRRSLECALALGASVSMVMASGCKTSAPPPEKPVPHGSASAMASFTVPSNKPPTKEGDAAEVSALETLAGPSFGRRNDKWDTLSIRFADWKNWKRVRIFGQPTRATFRYGDEASALAVVFYEASEGPSDTGACLDKFLRFADEMSTTYDIDFKKSPVYDREQILPDQTKKPLKIILAEGHVNAAFALDDYVGAAAAYESFPGTCLVQAFAAKATRHPDLARKARDIWVNECAPYLTWNSKKVAAGSVPSLDAQ